MLGEEPRSGARRWFSPVSVTQNGFGASVSFTCATYGYRFACIWSYINDASVLHLRGIRAVTSLAESRQLSCLLTVTRAVLHPGRFSANRVLLRFCVALFGNTPHPQVNHSEARFAGHSPYTEFGEPGFVNMFDLQQICRVF